MKIGLLSVFGLVVLASTSCRGDEEGDRIVGGDEVEAHSIPWQVLILRYGRQHCGGTILSATKILTAAHCIMDGLQVMVGEHNLVSAVDGVLHEIAQLKKHPNYNAQTVDNDIAIITLKKPIELGDKAKAACLPASATDPALEAGQLLTVSGWGRLAANDAGPNVLHSIEVPYMTNQQCRRSWGYGSSFYGSITSNMLCAGESYTGPDSNDISPCNGDSGGPLTLGNTIVGVLSFGARECKFRPAVYARVTQYLQWIKEDGVTNACQANPTTSTTTTATTTTTTSTPTKPCIDRKGRCNLWTQYCKNPDYQMWMWYNCSKSCGFCKAKPERCIDKDWRCPYWQKYCKDQVYQSYLRRTCSKTCGVC